MTILAYKNNTLSIDKRIITLDHDIKSAYLESDKIIVLYNPDSNLSKFGQFRNLFAIDLNGSTLWIAKLPTHNTGDCYCKILSKNPLTVLSFYSVECRINMDNGEIESATFIK